MDETRLLDRSADDRIGVLDPSGALRDGATLPDLTDAELVEMYEEMRLARRFDERVVSLQRQGRVGTYAPLAGQEGAQVGSTHAMTDEDWLSYQYREHAAVIVRDRSLLAPYLRYWMGHESGNAALADARIFPLNISIGSQVPHAVGLAWAAKLREDNCVVAVHFGDGATSEGDVHEAMNVAGVFDLPVVFVCHNNQWAISVPRERQTASATIAQKATAYGFDGVQVDGMDPLAVYAVTRAAREKATGEPSDGTEAGDGDRALRPTLIEAVQYRYGAHTTADDPSRYRDEIEVERWRERDPIVRLEAFLLNTGRLDEESVDAIESAVEAEVSDVIEQAQAGSPDPDDLFEHVYAEPTARVADQREVLRDLRERHGDDSLTHYE